MCIRLKHTHVFHHKRFWLKRKYCLYIFLNKFIILINLMIVLSVSFNKNLTRGAANNNINIFILP